MLVMAFLQWWYGPGWRDAGVRLSVKMRETYLSFSVPILARTLFAPWRRIMSPPGGSIQQKMRTMVDNTVSRFVGFTVRVMALVAAFVLLFVYAVGGGLLLLLWPAIPLLGPALIVVGLL